MTERERLIELIQNAVNGCARHWAEIIADYLLDNGVMLPKLGKPPTDLNGKCGSCVYAKPTEHFGGSAAYIDCTNWELTANRKRQMSAVKQRTNPACKKYQKRSDNNATQQPYTE